MRFFICPGKKFAKSRFEYYIRTQLMSVMSFKRGLEDEIFE